MMTRKDYKAIAEIIHVNHDHASLWVQPGSGYAIEAINRVTQHLADYMAQDNPNFDRDKFIMACYS